MSSQPSPVAPSDEQYPGRGPSVEQRNAKEQVIAAADQVAAHVKQAEKELHLSSDNKTLDPKKESSSALLQSPTTSPLSREMSSPLSASSASPQPSPRAEHEVVPTPACSPVNGDGAAAAILRKNQPTAATSSVSATQKALDEAFGREEKMSPRAEERKGSDAGKSAAAAVPTTLTTEKDSLADLSSLGTHLARAEAEAAVGRAALARKAIDAALVNQIQPPSHEDQMARETHPTRFSAAPTITATDATQQTRA